MIQRVFALVLALLCAVPVAAAAAPGDDIQAALDARTSDIPGSAIVAATVEGGRVRMWLSGTSGTERPLDEHTLFEIGSLTKTMTAALLAEMVLTHKVALDEPVQQLLPTSIRVPQRNGKTVTLLALATQRSGLPRMPANFSPHNPNDPYSDYDASRLAQFLNGYALTRDPGAGYEYSNLGFGLLGYALAQTSHASYETLLRKIVFDPLGMRESRVSLAMGDGRRMATGRTADGEPAGEWSFQDTFAGAGAVKSSLSDMIRYLRAAMGQGPLGATMRYAETPRAAFPGGRIGLAWMTDTSGVIWHNGQTGGYASVLRVSPDRTRGVIVMSSGPAIDDVAEHLLDPALPLRAQSAWNPPVAPGVLDEYAGRYAATSPAIGGRVFAKDGKLFAQLDGQTPVRLLPSHYADHFFNRDVGASLEFVRSGPSVVGAILTQGGQTVSLFRLDSSGKALATSLAPVFPAAQTLSPETAAAYAGTYTGTAFSYTVTTQGGHLFAKLASQPAIELFEEKPDVFYYKVVDAQVTFARDSAGHVVSATLHQMGIDTVLTLQQPHNS